MTIVVVVVWLMFAILAVNLFGGKFQHCSIDTYTTATERECLIKGGLWETYVTNFDNVLISYVTLYVISG